MRAIRILVPVLILTAATSVPAAPNILLLNIPAGSPGYYPAALNARGYTFTETHNVAAFRTALTNGTAWDLVLVDNYDGPFDDSTLVSLMNYIAKGGRCVLNYWDMDWALANILGANMRLSDYSYTTPIPVLRWEPSNSLLTTPNAIPDLTPVEGDFPYTVDGFYLQPHDDATAVAGYTPAAADYRAAIVIGNEGRTILLGITPELFGPDMEKLLENCIEYLFAPAPTPVFFVPFNVRLGNSVQPPNGVLSIIVDVTVKETIYAGVPCRPYIAVSTGDTLYYIVSGNKLATKMTPYLNNGKAKYFQLTDDISDYRAATIPFTSLAPGRYWVYGALLNKKGAPLGPIAERVLTIE